MAPKRMRETLEDLLDRPWCYYCDRDFDDGKILHDHQKAKHFHCLVGSCNRRLNTAGGLKVHMNQVHKEELDHVPNALPERASITPEIFGMEGIPQHLVDARTAQVARAYHNMQSDYKKKTGNPLGGTAASKAFVEAGQAAAKKRKTVDKEDIKRRVAERKAMQAAKKAGLVPPNNGDAASNGQNTPSQDTPTVNTPTPPPGVQAYAPPQMISAPSFNSPAPAAASYGHSPLPVTASLTPTPPPGTYSPAAPGTDYAMTLGMGSRMAVPGMSMNMPPNGQSFIQYGAPSPLSQQPPPGLPARPSFGLPALPGSYGLPTIPGLPARPGYSPQPAPLVHTPATPQPSSDDIEALINSEHKKYLAQQEETEPKELSAQQEKSEQKKPSVQQQESEPNQLSAVQQLEIEHKKFLAQREERLQERLQKRLHAAQEGIHMDAPEPIAAGRYEPPEPIGAAEDPRLYQTSAAPATEKPAKSSKAEADSKLMFSDNLLTPEEKKAQSQRYTIKQKPSMIQTSMETQGAAGAIGNEVEANDEDNGA